MIENDESKVVKLQGLRTTCDRRMRDEQLYVS
ncbi:unnamed protein product [Anisakis simplex]|uniref:Uncharacterized protein n=1 Tax=Anisakis simplex TaxID=6269 RepID=A0A0M3JH17_ANISI|nr:unnamed protein product [Anisakis simplex]